MNPVRVASHLPSTARRSPIPAALGILVVLLALDTWRAGTFPTMHGVAVDAGLAALVIVSAHVAPDLVTWVLLLVLLYWALTNAPAITALVERFTSAIPGA